MHAPGEDCPFSHGVHEQLLHPAKFRTALCRKQPGGCNREVKLCKCFCCHLESLATRHLLHASQFGRYMAFDQGLVIARAASPTIPECELARLQVCFFAHTAGELRQPSCEVSEETRLRASHLLVCSALHLHV